MSMPVMIMHLLLDAWSGRDPGRVPEPDLVMADPAQVEAYLRAGREDGFFAHIYFFHVLQTSPLICPGDRVLDLACGPANQLALMARMHPQSRFIGVDASETMLQRARETAERLGVSNIEFRQGDMARLDGFADASVDVIVSTMALHHLADLHHLQQAGLEMRRVLKPDGGLYIVDFGRLKRNGTRNFFSNDRLAKQPPVFAQDFRHSMAAAFSLNEIEKAFAVFGASIQVHSTLIAPFMVAICTGARRTLEEADQQRLAQKFSDLTREQRQDFFDFTRLFTRAGYPLACELG